MLSQNRLQHWKEDCPMLPLSISSGNGSSSVRGLMQEEGLLGHIACSYLLERIFETEPQAQWSHGYVSSSTEGQCTGDGGDSNPNGGAQDKSQY